MFSALAAAVAGYNPGVAAGVPGGGRHGPPPGGGPGEAWRGPPPPPGAPGERRPAGSDAGQLELPSPAAVNTVAAWFRLALPMNGWTLQSDARAADGTVSIYAQKGTKPLWISLKPSVGAPGTTYTMIGATVDSTKADSGR